MMRIATFGAAVLLLLVSVPFALAQTPPGKVLDVEAKVLDIVGIARGIEGALKDLGAKVTAQEIVIELAADVLFDFDKSDIKPAATDSLVKVADVLKGMGNSPAVIEGHTDGKGAEAITTRSSPTAAPRR